MSQILSSKRLFAVVGCLSVFLILNGYYSWKMKAWFNKAPATITDEGKFPQQKTEAEWKEQLSAKEYHVLREKGTERAGTGKYDKFYPEEGHFKCAACGNPLYSADSKFKSGCGWPAFDKHYAGSIKTNVDTTFGMRRVEIVCANCGGHLGHVFEGEHMTSTNERHCVNSASVKYDKGAAPDGLVEKKVLRVRQKL